MHADRLDDLNPPQREAVEHGDGPILILAGAGSGKTRVITARLARLVRSGVQPWRILAVTFTNKAAGEMRARAALLVDEERAKKMWIGTFHSTCARLLRLHAVEAGLPAEFVIFDDDDQKRLVSRVMKDLQIPEKMFTPRSMLSKIDQAKNEGIDASAYAPNNYVEDQVARVYVEYQRRLRASGGVDFGDLLLETLRLLDHPEAGPRLCRRFEHVLVDEFQDTNRVQYRLVQRLASLGNLCVVGDDDQSIYRWRGADVRNILDFERDYPGCCVVKLEQNYRSTEVVLAAANGVIARNVHRKQKRLFTEIAGGEPIVYFTADDERREAEFIVRAMQQLIATDGRSVRDFAVLYRMHAQSRAVEEALRAAMLPYKIYGGVRFFDRAEVKDLLGYLRVVCNPADEVSLERIVNVPPRGIGETTIERVMERARARGISSWEAMREAVGLGDVAAQHTRPRARKAQAQPPSGKAGTQATLFGLEPPSIVTEADAREDEPELARSTGEALLGAGPRKKLQGFVQLIEGLRERLRSGMPLSDLAAATLDGSGLLERLQAEGGNEAADRLGNLEELLNSIRDYEREAESPTMVGYLERVSLQSAADAEGGGVALMTVHAAKGLEFPVVFIAGLEEGTFPTVGQDDLREQLQQIEEERRLAYVAITRARERLVLTNAAHRRLFREQRLHFETPRLDPDDAFSQRESRFIGDIPEDLIVRPVSARRTPPKPAYASARPDATPTVRRQTRDDGTVVEREDEPEAHTGGRMARKAAARAAQASAHSEPRVEYEPGVDGEGGGFHVGQRVRHAKFGVGRVRAVSGSGAGTKLVIDFPTGQSTIVARFVEPVGG